MWSRPVFFVFLMLSPLAIAQGVQVIDGDTLIVRGERIRIEAINAPEEWHAGGPMAKQALIAIIGPDPVVCERSGVDRYNRVLATCFAAGRDIGAAMVRQGWARAYLRFSSRYAHQEEEARAAYRGFWAAPGQELKLWR